MEPKMVKIKGYDKYSVTEEGVVMSRKGKTFFALEGTGTDKAYVTLYNKEGQRKAPIAYLVARAFIPNPQMRPYVVHLNGDKTDNRAVNLAWSEKRTFRTGLEIMRTDLNGQNPVSYESVTEAAFLTGVSRCAIQNCVDRRSRTAGGYIWTRVI